MPGGLGGNVDGVVHEQKIRVFNFIDCEVLAALVLAAQADLAAAHRAGGVNRVGQKPERCLLSRQCSPPMPSVPIARYFAGGCTIS